MLKKILISILLILLVSCTIGRNPCKPNKTLPKGRQCDEFLL